MAIQIKHAFVSLKGDGTDATQVQPTNWNAAHAFTMATGMLVGRTSTGAGAAEEIPISAYMASLLNTADKATLAGLLGLFETGDVKYTFKTAAPTGWVLMLGGTGTPPNTIGKTGSAAALRANDDTFDLYSLIYAGCSDTIAPVSGGRTGNATNDFNAGKTIQVPNPVGRSPVGAGSATGTTSVRTLGQLYGAETYQLVTANLPPYTPSGTATFTGNPMNNVVDNLNASSTGGGAFPFNYPGSQTSLTPSGSVSFNGSPQGGTSTPHNIIHPVVALNAMVKL